MVRRGQDGKQTYKGRNDDNESLVNQANNMDFQLSFYFRFFFLNSDIKIVILTANIVN